MILDHLDVRSLLSCRLVKRFWNKAASSVMKPRPAWIRVDSVAYQIDGLYKCVTNSQDFPFRGLHITWNNTSTGSNANLKVQRYLKKFGKLHTHVRLQEMFCKNVEMLLSDLTEMKFLEVQGCFRYGLTGQVDPFSMPSLRTLSFKGLEHGAQLNLFTGEHGIQSVLKKVILAASALEKIEHVDCTPRDLVAAIWDADRVNLVSSMTLRGYSLYLDVCHKLVANPPTLTSLTISGISSGSSPHVAAMKSVLFASRDTLKTLSLGGVDVQLDEMPVFAQLQELGITTLRTNWSTKFPTLSGFHFPKLRRIRLDLGYGTMKQSLVENHELQHCETPIETVTLLELDRLLLPNDVEYLAKMLPCVSHVRLKYPRTCYGNSEFDTVTSSVWLLREFQSLRRLDIQGFPFNTSKDALDGLRLAVPHRKIHTVTSMDQFLTGISSREIRAKLGSLPKIEIDSFNIEISRLNGSLIDLRGK